MDGAKEEEEAEDEEEEAAEKKEQTCQSINRSHQFPYIIHNIYSFIYLFCVHTKHICSRSMFHRRSKKKRAIVTNRIEIHIQREIATHLLC